MIKWNEKFSVNHEEIDNQHKKLIDIIEEVAFIIHSKDFNFVNIVEIVSKLEDYIKIHFEYEEGLMLKHQYPYIELHTKEHNEMRVKIHDIKVFDLEKPNEFYSDTLLYLMDWLLKHIMQMDHQLGKFLNQEA